MAATKAHQITIAMLRTREKKTQEQMAKIVGVSIPTWQRWEKGESFPNALHLKKMQKEFGITLDELRF